MIEKLSESLDFKGYLQRIGLKGYFKLNVLIFSRQNISKIHTEKSLS